MMSERRPPSPTLVDNILWVVWNPIGFAQYDFAFEEHFPCSHPIFLDREITAIARSGSALDYPQRCAEMAEWGIRLINSPEHYQRSSLPPHWYPQSPSSLRAACGSIRYPPPNRWRPTLNFRSS
jgi:hypothetical protein